jgi:hypothetical protein
MPPTVYEIDPFADTVIILNNPCNNFAPWDETLESLNIEIAKLEDKQTIRNEISEDEAVGEKPTKRKEKKMWGKGKKVLKRGSAGTCNIIVPEDESKRAEPFHENLSEEHEYHQEPAPEPVTEPSNSGNKEIHYLVSSRHLMLASPWFRRTLTSEASTEAVKDPSDGRYHIGASDWDEEALFILLSIFHVRVRQIPDTVGLEMLAKIAQLVDYYELVGAEVIERDTSGWIAHMRRVAIPSSYCRDLMLWIWISQLFQMSEEFKQATAVAIRESQGCLQTLGLPIKDAVTCTLLTCLDFSKPCLL